MCSRVSVLVSLSSSVCPRFYVSVFVLIVFSSLFSIHPYFFGILSLPLFLCLLCTHIFSRLTPFYSFPFSLSLSWMVGYLRESPCLPPTGPFISIPRRLNMRFVEVVCMVTASHYHPSPFLASLPHPLSYSLSSPLLFHYPFPVSTHSPPPIIIFPSLLSPLFASIFI